MQFQFIRDIHAARLAAGKPVISFEFFPPKTEEGDRNLLEKTIPTLLQLKPDFCSVTYGAGGSTRDKTLMIVDRIQREHGLTAMLHLTCVNATTQQVGEVVDQARALGIKNILALRGDPIAGSNAEFQKTEGGFEYSYQLVTYLKQRGGFSIGTAGFPEGHIACKDGKQADWDHLINKINCGADFVITQLFFDNADFLEFRDYLTKRGVKVPIVPGIIPIQSTHQIKRFTALCGAKLPDRLLASLEKFTDDDAAATQFGIDYATNQCLELLRAGVPGLHIYTLNKAPSTVAIIKNLKLS
jgi:methylenetetrahydrofolate reductase (NADPH)